MNKTLYKILVRYGDQEFLKADGFYDAIVFGLGEVAEPELK